MRLNIFNITTLKNTDDKNIKFRTIKLINLLIPKIAMKQSPKILIASPTYEGMRYCHNEFFNAITSLDYPDYKILIVDNSEKEEYYNELKKIKEITVLKENLDEKNKMLRLIHSRNKILDYAFQNNYDYVLMLDSDVIPPKDCLKELLNCKKDLVSGLYYNYFIVDGKTQWLPVAWTELSDKDFQEIKQKINLPTSFTAVDLRVRMTSEEAESGKLIQVIIPSAGCLLIGKAVFSKIRYGLVDTSQISSKLNTTDDIYFILNAREQGFNPYCYTKVKCEHLVQGKFREDKDNVYHHRIYE